MSEAERTPPSGPEPRPFPDGWDVLFIAGLTLPALLAASLAVLALALAVPAWRAMRAAQVLAMQFLFWGIWFLALHGLIRFRHGGRFRPALGWIPPAGGYANPAGLGALTAGAVIVAALLLRPPRMPMPLLELLKDPLSLVLVGLFAVTFGPICEELAFRGFLLPWLARLIRPAPAVALTGALFAALHGPEYAWSWRHVLLIGGAGAAFGAVRWRTGSTAAAALMHAVYNLVFLAALLAQTGGRVP